MIRTFRRTLAAILLALAFLINTACATRQLPPPVAITVPCKVTPIPRPSFPFDTLSVGEDIFKQTQTLLADRKVRQGYEAKLEAGVESCR